MVGLRGFETLGSFTRQVEDVAAAQEAHASWIGGGFSLTLSQAAVKSGSLSKDGRYRQNSSKDI